ncbi:uncharacterized protein LOC115220723 [Octopus sinensis]|uniref:Uncharacterized protein LOC115220723 n=1 Tax=Octopus sinensis TaxID=2607531 RepID=A0A6P7TAI9_9MOLL|nr:uncharacterized protein LOC115220723 [Octopus sinensis]
MVDEYVAALVVDGAVVKDVAGATCDGEGGCGGGVGNVIAECGGGAIDVITVAAGITINVIIAIIVIFPGGGRIVLFDRATIILAHAGASTWDAAAASAAGVGGNVTVVNVNDGGGVVRGEVGTVGVGVVDVRKAVRCGNGGGGGGGGVAGSVDGSAPVSTVAMIAMVPAGGIGWICPHLNLKDDAFGCAAAFYWVNVADPA